MSPTLQRERMRTDKPLLTIPAAAQYLSVSANTINRLLKRGRLTKVVITRGCVRVRRSELEALANGEKEAA